MSRKASASQICVGEIVMIVIITAFDLNPRTVWGRQSLSPSLRLYELKLLEQRCDCIKAKLTFLIQSIESCMVGQVARSRLLNEHARRLL